MKKHLSIFIAAMNLCSFQVRAEDSNIKRAPIVYDNFELKILDLFAPNERVRTNVQRITEASNRTSSKPVIRNKTASFLARIQSSYYDESQKKWRVIQGLGTFVNLKLDGKERTAVISVSHVTQGQQLRIYDTKGEVLPILPGARLANVDEDVEIVFLKDKIETPFSELNSVGAFITDASSLNDRDLEVGVDLVDYDRIYVAKRQHVPILKSLLPKNSSGTTFESFNQDRDTIIRNLLGKKKTKVSSLEEMKGFGEDIWDEYGTLQKQFMGNGYVANARMLPGLSGAPLIRDVPWAAVIEQGGYVNILEGLVQGHHRFENKSYFVGAKSIGKLVRAFHKGERNYTSQTRWRLRDGSTFRDYGNGVLETTLIKMPSASFYKGESGNAISVDGDINPTAINLGIGVQSGYNSTIVGQYVEIGDRKLPVLADPRINENLPKGMTLRNAFGGNQDLLALAELKTQFQDTWASSATNFECFYQVTKNGIELQINKFKGENVLTWKSSKENLSKGFQQNNLFVKNSTGTTSAEISGLFLTDLTSILDTSDLKDAGAPTVTVLPQGADAERIGCYANSQQRAKAYKLYLDQTTSNAQQTFGTPISVPNMLGE